MSARRGHPARQAFAAASRDVGTDSLPELFGVLRVQVDHIGWPQFGPAAVDSIGVRSVLSIRLSLDDPSAMAGLNLYSYERGAFDEHAEHVAMLLATHAGVMVSSLLAREKAANLEIALKSNREIGRAIGVLMTTYKITRDDAFDLLRITSQRTHRKLRDVAAEVVDTGTLQLP